MRAAVFLAKKAIFLTIVATASSRLPQKGSTAAQVTSHSRRHAVDLSALTKEPFFQRAHMPPPQPSGGGGSTGREREASKFTSEM